MIFSPVVRAYLDLHEVDPNLPHIGPDMASAEIALLDKVVKSAPLTDVQEAIENERLRWLSLLRDVLDAGGAVAPEVVARWAEALDRLRKDLEAWKEAQRPGDEKLQLWDANNFTALVEAIGARIEQKAASGGRRYLFNALLRAFGLLDAAEEAMLALGKTDITPAAAVTAEKALRGLVTAVEAMTAVCQGKCWATVPEVLAGLYLTADAADKLLAARATVHAAEMASVAHVDEAVERAEAAAAAAPDPVAAAEAQQEAVAPLARELEQRADRAESGASLSPAVAAQAEDAASALALGEAVDQGYEMLALAGVGDLSAEQLLDLKDAVRMAEELFVEPGTSPDEARRAADSVVTAIDPIQNLLPSDILSDTLIEP